MKRSVAVAVLIGLLLFALPVVALGQWRWAEKIQWECDQLETRLFDLRKKYPENHPRIVLVKERLAEYKKSYPCLCLSPSVALEGLCHL